MSTDARCTSAGAVRCAKGDRSREGIGVVPPKTKADRLVEKAESLPPRDVTEKQFQASGD